MLKIAGTLRAKVEYSGTIKPDQGGMLSTAAQNYRSKQNKQY